MKHCTSPTDLPTGKHFSVVVFNTKFIQHEGDQRSRDCPGHGYPAYTETVNTCDYITFDSEEQLKYWINLQAKNDIKYVVLEAIRKEIKIIKNIQLS